jgi:hypothetical protein
MLTIDRLSLTLPPGFEDRAAAIAELVARRLAALRLDTGATIERLRVDDLQAGPAMTDEGIAAQVADAVQRRLAEPGSAAGQRVHERC